MGLFDWLSDQAKQTEFGGNYRAVQDYDSMVKSFALLKSQQDLEDAKRQAGIQETFKNAQTESYNELAEKRRQDRLNSAIKTFSQPGAPEFRPELIEGDLPYGLTPESVASMIEGVRKQQALVAAAGLGKVGDQRENLDAKTDKTRFDIERGRTLLPGEVGLQGDRSRNLNARTANTNIQAQLNQLKLQNGGVLVRPQERSASAYQKLAVDILSFGAAKGLPLDPQDIAATAEQLRQDDMATDAARGGGVPSRPPMRPLVPTNTLGPVKQPEVSGLDSLLQFFSRKPAQAQVQAPGGLPPVQDTNQPPPSVAARGGIVVRGKLVPWSKLTAAQRAEVWKRTGGN